MKLHGPKDIFKQGSSGSSASSTSTPEPVFVETVETPSSVSQHQAELKEAINATMIREQNLRWIGFGLIICTLLVVLLVSLSACSPAQSQVSIALDYEAGSGYVWTYSENPEGLFEFQHMETLDKSSSDDGDSSKVNAQDIFEFSAINSGDVELNFILARPETGDDIQAQVSYSFSIDSSHNVKLVDSHGTLDVIPEPTISS